MDTWRNKDSFINTTNDQYLIDQVITIEKQVPFNITKYSNPICSCYCSKCYKFPFQESNQTFIRLI